MSVKFFTLPWSVLRWFLLKLENDLVILTSISFLFGWSGRGRGRGSYQADAPRGRFGARNMGRGSNLDNSDYSRLRGDGYLQRSSRWEKNGKSMDWEDAIERAYTISEICAWCGYLLQKIFLCGFTFSSVTFWVRLFLVKAIETLNSLFHKHRSVGSPWMFFNMPFAWEVLVVVCIVPCLDCGGLFIGRGVQVKKVV